MLNLAAAAWCQGAVWSLCSGLHQPCDTAARSPALGLASVNTTKRETTISTSTNQPIGSVRDGALKATIWKNFGENGTFYSVELSRTYKQGYAFKDSHSFSGTEPNQIARLAHLACTRIGELRQHDARRLDDQVA